MPKTFPTLTLAEPGSNAAPTLGHPLVDSYLESVHARLRPNSTLAVVYDLKVFFTVIDVDPLVREARGPAESDPWDAARQAMPAVPCGDFNAEPDSDEIRFLCGLAPLGGRDTFYQDAWRVAGDHTPGYTNHWSNRLGGNLNIHRKRIDYVFVGDPFVRRDSGGRVINAQIVMDDVIDGWPPSDHSGVLAEISWPEERETDD